MERSHEPQSACVLLERYKIVSIARIVADCVGAPGRKPLTGGLCFL